MKKVYNLYFYGIIKKDKTKEENNMGIWANIKARREAKKQQEIDNEIERIEQHKGKRLSEKGVEKVTKRVEDRRAKRLRNTLIAILGSLGLAVGGHALLSDGNQVNQQNNKNNIEMENDTTTSRKEAYLKELQDMSQYADIEISQEKVKDTHIVDEVRENYNDNLLDQAEIDKEDLGIILQGYVGDGHIIEKRSKDGEISYIEDASKNTEDLTSEQKWVEGKDIEHIYVLVDNKHKNTVAGIGIIDGQYCEIDVEQVRNPTDGTVYEKNDQTYVGIPEQFELREIYDNFANYFEERLEKIEKNDEIEH